MLLFKVISEALDYGGLISEILIWLYFHLIILINVDESIVWVNFKDIEILMQ